ncbi:MAG: S8 family serine peptidase [Planctomycetes bacterium]|nr:S8 family serine peptidase [Planctomycetota bacterium]
MSTIRWLLLLLLLVPACAPPAQPSVSDEQTAQEHLSPDRLEAPALERKLHLANLGVMCWHQQDVRGHGIKIAILDSGFRGYRQFLGKGLPKNVSVRSFRRDENLEARDSQHGILCGEVLHAIAPDAEVLLVNWEPDSSASFLDAVRWAKNQGAKVMSCSLIMPSWSDGEGGGEVHRVLAPLLDGVLFFASAGNTAQRHWCGLYAPNDAGWHRWRGDCAENVLTPWGKERVAVEFYGPTQSSFQLSIVNGATGDTIGRSYLQVDATRKAGRAVVRFEPDADTAYQVKVRCVDSPIPTMEAFHMVVLGGSLEHTTTRGSIPFPGDGAHVLAVGAVDGRGDRLAYSSCGPNSRLPKPDFVAMVPFPSLCREKPFAGTSAAAPQAAGLAALLWSKQQSWTAVQVTRGMRESALDLGPPGHDHETGYGLIRLPK